VNDMKARLRSVALSLGDCTVKIVHAVGATMTKAIAAGAAYFLRSNSQDGDSPPLQLAPKLFIAAAIAGALPALVIVLGFVLLDGTGSAVVPLEARLSDLTNRVEPVETAQMAPATRIAAAETALQKTAAAVNAAAAETQQIKKSLALLPGRNVVAPEQAAAALSGVEQLQDRVAALENRLGIEAKAEMRQPAPAAGTGEAESNFPPFDPVNFLPELIWLALTFGALYIAMAKIALPRVHTILQARAHKISADIEDANKFRARSEEAAAAHEKLVNDGRSQALALAQQTHAKLLSETESKRAALESDLGARLAESEAQIVQMKARAMSNVETIASEAASAIVQRITGRPADGAAIARAFAALKS
jgi:F-type H+-transporting ATPase subunit b